MRANRHSILRTTMETFWQKTDPFGRTVEERLTEQRGHERITCNIKAREKWAKQREKLPPKTK